MSHLQLAAVFASVALLLIVLELVRRRRLLERYALLWLAVGVALVVLGAWRGLLTSLAKAAGIFDPTNALFAAGVGFLLLIVLNLSVVISRLNDETKVLAQRSAILEAELRQMQQGLQGAAGREADEAVSADPETPLS